MADFPLGRRFRRIFLFQYPLRLGLGGDRLAAALLVADSDHRPVTQLPLQKGPELAPECPRSAADDVIADAISTVRAL